MLSHLFLLSTPGMTAEPVSVGLRKQLLVDDWVVAEKSGVTRELGRVETVSYTHLTLPTKA